MKSCPYCSADNRDDALNCYFCGGDLRGVKPSSSSNRPAGSTAPLRPATPRSGSAPAPSAAGSSKDASSSASPQAGPQNEDAAFGNPAAPSAGSDTGPAYEAGDTQPTRPFRPAPPSIDDTQPGARVYPSPGDTQPYAASGAQVYPPQSGDTLPYTPAGGGPTYSAPSASETQPYSGQPPYGPPPSGAVPSGAVPSGAQPPARSSRLWTYLPLLLVVMLLCACGLAVWTLTAVTGNGVAGLGRTVVTRAAEVFDLPTAVPLNTFTPAPFEPSPWPTFTLAPTEPPAATATQLPPAPSATLAPPATMAPPATAPADPTLNPTEEAGLDRLLSPECSGALERLQELSGQLTQNPASALNEDWRTDFDRALDDMRAFCGDLDTASPVPGRLSEARQTLSEASAEFDEAARLFNEGVQERSPAKLLEAGRHVTSAAAKLGRALEIIRELGG